jgi:hypothetical protein
MGGSASQIGTTCPVIVQGWRHMVHRHGKRLNHERLRLRQVHPKKAEYISGKDPMSLIVKTILLEAIQPTNSTLKENES